MGPPPRPVPPPSGDCGRRSVARLCRLPGRSADQAQVTVLQRVHRQLAQAVGQHALVDETPREVTPTQVPLQMPGSARVMRQVVALMATDRVLAQILNDAVAGNVEWTDPAFVQDPYPFYDRARAAGNLFLWEDYDRVCAVSYPAVMALLKDRRMGREAPAEFARPVAPHTQPF